MNTKAIFEQLLSIIKVKKTDQLQYLRNGLSREEIESKIKKSPIPEAIIDIYSFLAGLEDDDLSIYLSWSLIYIDEINDVIDMLESNDQDMIDSFPDYDLGLTSRHMIPFLSDGCGNFMAIKNLPDDQSIWYIPKDDDSFLEFISINHLLLTSIECYEQNAYFWNEEERFWDTDYDFVLRILAEVRERLETQNY